MDSESVVVPSTQSNCKVKPSTSSSRSKLSLRRKKGKGSDNVTSSSSPNKANQTVNSHLTAPVKTGNKQETVCETPVIEVKTSLPQNVIGSETFDKTKGMKGSRFSLVLDKVVVPLCSVPMSTDEQSMVQLQTGHKLVDSQASIHSPSVLDSTTQTGHSHLTNAISTPQSTNAQTDAEACSSKDVDLSKSETSSVFENVYTCHICKKDVSNLSLFLRQEHIDRCSEPVGETEEQVSTGAICLICKKQLKSEEAKFAHMKQCAKKEGISTTQLLALVRDPQSTIIVPSDDSASSFSQRKLEDLLSKKHGSGILKLGDLQLAGKEEDDDFKKPLPRTLGRKRKKEDFQESYLQNLEDEQLQLALALSASIDSVSLRSTCTVELERIPTGGEESRPPGRKRPKKAKKNKVQIVPPLLAVTSEQAQDLRTRRAEEILKGGTVQDSDEIPCTPAFGSSDLANHVKPVLSLKVNAAASLETEQDDHILFLSDDDDQHENGSEVQQPCCHPSSDVLDLELSGSKEDMLVSEENEELTEAKSSEVIEEMNTESPMSPCQSITYDGGSKENFTPLREQTSSLKSSDLAVPDCNPTSTIQKEEEKVTSLSSSFQFLDYPTLWQLSSYEKNGIEDFYVPALSSLVSPVKKQTGTCLCKACRDELIASTSHTIGDSETEGSKTPYSPPKRQETNFQMQTSSLNSSSANNNIRKLCSDLLELVGSTLFNDVEISTKSGTVVSAHAVLLAARCPALKKVLSCSNSRPIRLDFTDYEDSVVLNFLRFIYTGSLPPATSTENMEHPLVDLAHKWSIEELMLTSNHTSSVTTAEEIAPATRACLITPLVKDVVQAVPIDINSDQGSTSSGEANPPSIIVEAIEEEASVDKHCDIEHVVVEMDNIEVIMDDSDNSKHCHNIDSVGPDNSPTHSHVSVVDSNLDLKLKSCDMLHHKATPHESILISPEVEEAEVVVDFSLSPTFSDDNSYHDLNVLLCSPNVSSSQENTTSCSNVQTLHGKEVPEVWFEVCTSTTSCARSNVSVSSSETTEVQERPSKLSPSDEIDLGQLATETSYTFVDSPPMFEDFKSPPLSVESADFASNSPPLSVESADFAPKSPPLSVEAADFAPKSPPLSVESADFAPESPPLSVESADFAPKSPPLIVDSASSESVPYKRPGSTPSIRSLKTPRDLRSIARRSLEGGSGNSTYKTPVGIGRLQIESDDNITPLPNYHAMFTPLLKKQCGRFGVKPLPKRKMIAKLQEIYEYTHPLVDTNGDVIQPQQDPPKQKTSKIQAKKDKKKATAEERPGTTADSKQATDETSSDLKTRIKDCISSNRELYQDILLFKPLELSMIQSKLKESGLSVSKDKLMDFLDQWCVTFSTPRRTDTHKTSSTQEP